MKYDRNWLKGIEETWHIIRTVPFDKVPFPHRPTIQKQFNAQVEFFKHELDAGLDTSSTQSHILDLAVLAVDLIHEAEKAAVE